MQSSLLTPRWPVPWKIRTVSLTPAVTGDTPYSSGHFIRPSSYFWPGVSELTWSQSNRLPDNSFRLLQWMEQSAHSSNKNDGINKNSDTSSYLIASGHQWAKGRRLLLRRASSHCECHVLCALLVLGGALQTSATQSQLQSSVSQPERQPGTAEPPVTHSGISRKNLLGL